MRGSRQNGNFNQVVFVYEFTHEMFYYNS